MGTILIAVAIAGMAIGAVAVPSYQLVITAEDGHVMWRVPVRLDTSVVLAYTNSIYLAPTEETLQISADGFIVTQVRSTSEAVLAYNSLPPPYRREEGYVTAAAHSVLPALLPLRIGQTGRQRLIVGGRTLPLFEAGIGARVTLKIVRAPLTSRWTRW